MVWTFDTLSASVLTRCMFHQLLISQCGPVDTEWWGIEFQTQRSASSLTSSLSQYSMISVHRLLQVIVPRFCWLLLRLQESLYSMYGVPVSICAPMMWSHNFLAGITRRPRPSLSYLRNHQTRSDHYLLRSLCGMDTLHLQFTYTQDSYSPDPIEFSTFPSSLTYVSGPYSIVPVSQCTQQKARPTLLLPAQDNSWHQWRLWTL